MPHNPARKKTAAQSLALQSSVAWAAGCVLTMLINPNLPASEFNLPVDDIGNTPAVVDVGVIQTIPGQTGSTVLYGVKPILRQVSVEETLPADGPVSTTESTPSE